MSVDSVGHQLDKEIVSLCAIVQKTLQQNFGINLTCEEALCDHAILQGKYSIALSPFTWFPSELLGCYNHREDIIFLYIFPNSGASVYNSEVLVSNGCFVDRDKKIKPFHFDKPIPVSLFIAGTPHKNDKLDGLPLYSANEVLSLFAQKDLFHQFLEQHSIATPKSMTLHKGLLYKENIVSFVKNHAIKNCVVKPNDSWEALGVKMFSTENITDENSDIVLHIDNLFKSDDSVLFQQRIEPFPIFRHGERMDWKMRVLVIPSQQWRSDLVRVEYKQYDNNPISTAQYSPLPQFMNDNEWDEEFQNNFLKELTNCVSSLQNVLKQEFTNRAAGLFALDVMYTEDKIAMILECNGGPVGGIAELEGQKNSSFPLPKKSGMYIQMVIDDMYDTIKLYKNRLTSNKKNTFTICEESHFDIMAVIYKAGGFYIEAEQCLLQAVGYDKGNLFAYSELLYIRLVLKKYDTLDELFDNVFTQKKTYRQVLPLYAVYLYKMKKRNELKKLFNDNPLFNQRMRSMLHSILGDKALFEVYPKELETLCKQG